MENVTVKQYHQPLDQGLSSLESMDGGAKLAPDWVGSGSLFDGELWLVVFPNSPSIEALVQPLLGVAERETRHIKSVGRCGVSYASSERWNQVVDGNKDGQCDGKARRLDQQEAWVGTHWRIRTSNTIRVNSPRIRVRVKPPDRSAAKDGPCLGR